MNKTNIFFIYKIWKIKSLRRFTTCYTATHSNSEKDPKFRIMINKKNGRINPWIVKDVGKIFVIRPIYLFFGHNGVFPGCRTSSIDFWRQKWILHVEKIYLSTMADFFLVVQYWFVIMKKNSFQNFGYFWQSLIWIWSSFWILMHHWIRFINTLRLGFHITHLEVNLFWPKMWKISRNLKLWHHRHEWTSVRIHILIFRFEEYLEK